MRSTLAADFEVHSLLSSTTGVMRSSMPLELIHLPGPKLYAHRFPSLRTPHFPLPPALAAHATLPFYGLDSTPSEPEPLRWVFLFVSARFSLNSS